MVGSRRIPIVTNVSPWVNRGRLLVGYLVFVGFGEKTTGVERVFESLCTRNIVSRRLTANIS